MEYEKHSHEFPPLFDENSRILILGSFPSVKSREQSFYYGHPQNRFWKVLSAVTGEQIPVTTEEKRQLVLSHGIALWDVVEECEIRGSSDSSIRNVVPTDLMRILKAAPVRNIYANGSLAKKLYDKYQKNICGREIILLPSTSPANASWSFQRLLEALRIVGE